MTNIEAFKANLLSIYYTSKKGNLEKLRKIVKLCAVKDTNIPAGWSKFYSCSGGIWYSAQSGNTEDYVSIEDFDMNEFVLPKKWYVERNPDNFKDINDYFNKNGYSNYHENDGYLRFPYHGFSGSGFNDTGHLYYMEEATQEGGYEKITFQQFKDYVLNKKVTEDVKVPVGYIAPINVFAFAYPNNQIKKGDTLFPVRDGLFYCKLNETDSDFFLPKEVVEVWDPIYEDPIENYTIGDKDIPVVFKKEGIFIDEKEWSLGEMNYLLRTSNHKGYQVKTEVFTIGCTVVIREDLERLYENAVRYYKKSKI